MKTYFHINRLTASISSLFLLLAFTSWAQNGIYKNPEDFLKNTPAFSGLHTHIRLHETFNRGKIDVKYNDSVFTFQKKDIYGYRDEEGISYRFFNEEVYTILNSSESMLLYKKISGTGLKGSPYVESYFFSTQAESNILPLDMKHLEMCYGENKHFIILLEATFKNDRELSTYDAKHKTYKLTRVFDLSNEENSFP